MKVIQSEAILGRVIEVLNLNTEWAKKSGMPEALKTADSIKILRSMIDLSPERNTTMINIRVNGDNPDEPARIANKIAEIYKQSRLEKNQENMQQGIDSLKIQLAKEQDAMQRAQSNVNWLRTYYRVIDTDPQSTAPTPQLSSEITRQIQADEVNSANQLVMARTQLEGLSKLTPEQRRSAIQIISGGDSELGTLLNELDIAEQNVITKEKTYTPNINTLSK